MSKKIYIGVRIDAELEAKFKRLAEREKRPPSQLIRVLIERFVESQPSKKQLVAR